MADERRMECVMEMVARGFERQILLANDISRATYLKARGGWGYVHLLATVVPELQKRGLSSSQRDLLLCDNPSRFLRFADSHSVP